MGPIGSVLRAPLKVLGLVKSPGRAPSPLPSAQRDDEKTRDQMLDELQRRRGGAADLLFGAGGAELGQSGTGKTTLGS